MQTVSELYNEIIVHPNHWFETALVIGELGGLTIDDAAYRENTIFSLRTSHRLFKDDYPTVGSAVAGEIDVEMVDPAISIPKMAKVRPYVRATDGARYSEWLPRGVFYVDTREVTRNSNGLDVLTIHGYDDIAQTAGA